MTGLRVASASSVAILLASADTLLTSTGSRWREELLLSPLGPVTWTGFSQKREKVDQTVKLEACNGTVEI